MLCGTARSFNSPSAFLPGDSQHMVREVVAKFQSLKVLGISWSRPSHSSLFLINHHCSGISSDDHRHWQALVSSAPPAGLSATSFPTRVHPQLHGRAWVDKLQSKIQRSNLCLLMICNPRYENLTRLGRIWLAGGESSLGLRLIPLITFCNQTVLLKSSELGSDTEANNQGFWFPATNEFYHHLHISQIWQLIEVLFATLLAKMAFAHVLWHVKIIALGH